MLAPAHPGRVAPARDDTVAISFEVQTTYAPGVVVWASVANSPATLCDRVGAVNIGLGGGDILISVLGWRHHPITTATGYATSTLEVIGSVVVNVQIGAQRSEYSARLFPVGAGGETQVVMHQGAVPCVFADVSATYANEQERRATIAAREMDAWLRKTRLTFSPGCRPYLAPTMVEADWAHRGSFGLAPALSGWPQLKRLTFDPATYWPRAVEYACLLLEPDIATILAEGNADALRVLAVAALTAFAGNYPGLPETVDDRSLGALKLGRNRDCDDMAITVVAAFNVMQAAGIVQYTSGSTLAYNALSCLVHTYLVTQFNTAACVVCRAVAHVAKPGVTASKAAKRCGHVFAILSPAVADASGQCRGLFENAAVVEATRISSPFAQSLDSHVGAAGHRLFGRKHLYELDEPGIRCVKPLNVNQYPECIAAYTATRTYALTTGNVIGIPMSALLIGGAAACATLVVCPRVAAYSMAAAQLSHCISLEEVDRAVNAYCWYDKLGLSKSARPVGATPAIAYDYTGDTRQVHSKGMKICNITLYGFVAVDGENTATDVV